MSIYSGFGTRKQEQEYNQSIGRLLHLLSSKIVDYHMKQQLDDQKFIVTFGKVYGSLMKLEQNKYLPPKFTEVVNDLAKVLGFFCESMINVVGSNSSTTQQTEHITKNNSIVVSVKHSQNMLKTLNNNQKTIGQTSNNSPRLPQKSQSRQGINPPFQNQDEGYKTDKQELTGDNFNLTYPRKQKENNEIEKNSNKIQKSKQSKGQQIDKLAQKNGMQQNQNQVIQVSDVLNYQQNTLIRQNSLDNNNNISMLPPPVLLNQTINKPEDLLAKLNQLEDSNKYVNLDSSDTENLNYELNDSKLKQENDVFLNQWNMLCKNVYNYQWNGEGTAPKQQNAEQQQQLQQQQQQQGEEDKSLDPLALETLNFQMIQKQRQQFFQQQSIKNQQYLQSQILNQKILNMQQKQKLNDNLDNNNNSNNNNNNNISKGREKQTISQSLQRYQRSSPQPKNRASFNANSQSIQPNNRYQDNQKGRYQILSQKKENVKKINSSNTQNNSNIPAFNIQTSNKNSSTYLRMLPELNQSAMAQNQSLNRDAIFNGSASKNKISEQISPNLVSLNLSNISYNQNYQFQNDSAIEYNKHQQQNATEVASSQFQNRLKSQINPIKEHNQDSLKEYVNQTKRQQLVYQNRESLTAKQLKTEAIETINQNSPPPPKTNQSYTFSNNNNNYNNNINNNNNNNNNIKSGQNGGKSKKSPYNSIVLYPNQQKNKDIRIANIQIQSEQDGDIFNLDQSIQRIYRESKAYSTSHKDNKQILPYHPQSTKNATSSNEDNHMTTAVQQPFQGYGNAGLFITPIQ